MPESHRFCLSCGSDTTRLPEAKDPFVGETLVGKYAIVKVLGSGAMGTIYKAEQTALGKAVVIKVLHRHLLADPELIERFHREARAASRLNHPNCVQILDFGTLEDGSLYIAMEYIQGIDLATLLEREHPIDHRRLIAIIKQVCQALDEAHANGVLHRDLKPENIMIEDRRLVRDHVKVVDFGIAKLEENNPGSRRSFQTRTGIVCGTPEYMSPEQARGIKLDARSDLYAIGVMLYHLTTDRLPFEASSPIEVVTKHLSEPPVPPHVYRADIPEALERLILTLLEKDREKRPASALDVHAELERIDRELAAERRERIEPKSSDDATIIDMRPISELVAAIDTAGAVVERRRAGVGDDTTDGHARAALEKAGTAGTASDLSLTDTVPEPAGRQVKTAGRARQASAGPEGSPSGPEEPAEASHGHDRYDSVPMGGSIQRGEPRPSARQLNQRLAALALSESKNASGSRQKAPGGPESAVGSRAALSSASSRAKGIEPAPPRKVSKPPVPVMISQDKVTQPGPGSAVTSAAQFAKRLEVRGSLAVEAAGSRASEDAGSLAIDASSEPAEASHKKRIWLRLLLGGAVIAAGATVAFLLSR